MSLLVSDFDGTICDTLGFVPNGTVSQIERFMESGNKFMIATARSYSSIINKVDKHGIPYDFISTMNGYFVHDKDGNIIYSKESVLLDIMDPDKFASFLKKINFFKNNNRDVYYFIYTKALQCLRDLILLVRDNSSIISDSLYSKLASIQPFCDKVESIRFVQDLLGIDDCDVITIGDDTNDLQMIRNYYGYGVVKFFSNQKVLSACSTRVKSLNDSFQYINKNI